MVMAAQAPPAGDPDRHAGISARRHGQRKPAAFDKFQKIGGEEGDIDQQENAEQYRQPP